MYPKLNLTTKAKVTVEGEAYRMVCVKVEENEKEISRISIGDMFTFVYVAGKRITIRNADANIEVEDRESVF